MFESRCPDHFVKANDMPSWFQGEVKTTRQVMVPVQVKWICPEPGCGGEMEFNGDMWPTMTPGYHHKCSKCGQVLVIQGVSYPTLIHEPKGKK